MKYKADYSKKYTFIDFFNSDTNQIWFAFEKNEVLSDESRTPMSINKDKHIFCGSGSWRPSYKEACSLDWYKAYEDKEVNNINNDFIIPNETVARTDDTKKTKNELLKMIDKKTKKQQLKESLDYIRNLNLKIENAYKEHNILEAEAFISGEFKGIDDFMETQLYINGIKPNKQNKQKKQKQEFDGDNKIWIHNEEYFLCNNDYFYDHVTDEKKIELGYRQATQRDINKFFNGSKKRKKISRELDDIMYYHTGGEHFYKRHTSKNGSGFMKISKTEYLKDIVKNF